MSDRETVPTVHGEVPYETVECVSCEERVAAKNTKDVIVGEVTRVKDYNHRPDRYEFGNGMERGNLCEYCRDDPAAYPSGRYFDLVASTRAVIVAALFVLGVYLL
jgi:hypothetical protein